MLQHNFLPFLDLYFCWYFLLFILSIVISWFIPGRVIVGKHFFLSVFIGMVLWGWIGILQGFLRVRFLLEVYTGIFLLIWLYRGLYKEIIIVRTIQWKKHRTLLLIMIIGVIIQQIPLFYSGIPTKNGIVFSSELPIDSLWHLGLTQSFVEKFIPDIPGLGGITLINYHYFLNLITADLIRVFRLPLIPTQLRFIPIFLSSMYGLGILAISNILKLKRLGKTIFLLLGYFATDVGFLPILLLSKTFHWDYLPLYISQKAAFNLPMLLSTIGLWGSILLLKVYEQKPTRKWFMLSIISIGAIIAMKTHMGVILLGSLGVVSATEVSNEKKFDLFFLFILSTLLAGSFYITTNSNSGGLYLSWFWRIEQIATNPLYNFNPAVVATISYWTKEKRLFYADVKTILFVLFFEFKLLIIFIVSTYGTMISSVTHYRTFKRIYTYEDKLFLLMSLSSFLLGTFTLQTSGVGHSYNFLIIAFITLLYPSAKGFESIFAVKKISIVGLLFIAIVTVNIFKTVYHTNQALEELRSANKFTITNDELEAIRRINNAESQGYVLLSPHEPKDIVIAYLEPFLSKPLYSSGILVLAGSNVPYQDRLTITKKLFSTDSLAEFEDIKNKEHIEYIFVTNGDEPRVIKQNHIQSWYENDSIKVYK